MPRKDEDAKSNKFHTHKFLERIILIKKITWHDNKDSSSNKY